MLSFPAPRMSCRSRLRVAHSSAYRSGSSPYVFWMYDFSGVIQSISFVALRGTEIIGACVMMSSSSFGTAQRQDVAWEKVKCVCRYVAQPSSCKENGALLKLRPRAAGRISLGRKLLG